MKRILGKLGLRDRVQAVYLRSLADSDSDSDGDGVGVGDLAGLSARLDHLTRLGVDALRLNPCYPSPGVSTVPAGNS